MPLAEASKTEEQRVERNLTIGVLTHGIDAAMDERYPCGSCSGVDQRGPSSKLIAAPKERELSWLVFERRYREVAIEILHRQECELEIIAAGKVLSEIEQCARA